MHSERSLFFSSRRRHTRWNCDWSSDVCSSDLEQRDGLLYGRGSADMKAGIAAMCAAALRAHDAGALGGEVIVAAVADEIGRASCRERGVAMGGRRILKIKTIAVNRRRQLSFES